MRIPILGSVALFALSQGIAFAQSAPAPAVDISAAQVQAVLKYAPPAVDQTLKVVDLGGYQLSVAVIHREAPKPRPAGGAPPASANAIPDAEKCGLASAPAGVTTSAPGMIAHSDTVETYIVISGGGTLVTGGQIVNGRRSAPDSEVTKILNGPSCSGRAVGNDIVSRKMGVGDISVIPAGTPHGWTGITTEVTYLSVRPDPNKVLPHNYVNPHLADAK